MFEIGNTLREARLRRGLDISRCEAETKIRAKYLRAMEEEQFDLLPAPTYVRGFLRSYADFLDLDGQLVLDEYESRFGELADGGHDVELRPRPARGRAQSGPRRAGPGAPRGAGGAASPRNNRPKRSSEARLLWLAIGGVMAVALLVWLGVGDGGTERSAIPATPQSITTPTAPTDSIVPPPPPGPASYTIVLTGVGEIGSFLTVHGLNQNGRQLYNEVLEPGESIRFTVKRRLWVRWENPSGLELRVNGRVRELPETAGSFYLTRRGAQAIDAG